MDSKARSKPMREILERLVSFPEFETFLFGDKMILDEPVEQWPSCDILISFFSTGFPLEKAIKYVKERKPFCVNDLQSQQLLFDRRMVLLILEAIDVSTPKRLCVNRDSGPNLPPELVEKVGRDFDIDFSTLKFEQEPLEQIDYDTIKVGNKILKKPFVEKPVDCENHNIYVYFAEADGGGVRKLFRKVNNKSSEFFPDEYKVRTDASYIYEEFLETENSEDVKVYTVGPYKAHAETRK